MQFFPRSRDECGKVIYLPFRAYVLLAFVSVELLRAFWPQHGGVPDSIILVVLGYMGCFVVFILGAVVQLATHRGAQAATNFFFAFITFLIWCHSLHYLAST